MSNDPMFDLVGKKCLSPCNPPYTFDCWTLVRHVRKKYYNLETPIITANLNFLKGAECVKQMIEEGYVAQWDVVEGDYKEGDVLLLAIRDADIMNHVGVFVGPELILHATAKQVMCSGIGTIKRVYKAYKVYRWPSVTS